MDELEIQLIAVLRQRYQPAFASGSITRTQMDMMIRTEVERCLPILHKHREESGATGPLTEDEVTVAGLENSRAGIEKTISKMQQRLDEGLDPLRQKLVEGLIAGAQNKLETVRKWENDPASIKDEETGTLGRDAALDARKMIGIMEESAQSRMADLVHNGRATPGDDLFQKYDSMKAATDATLTSASDPQTWFANQQEARRLQAEFYALLKTREKEAYAS